MRLSRSFKAAEETVTIIHDDGTTEQASMIIREDKIPRFDENGYILQDNRFIATVSNPRFNIEINDQIRRNPRSNTTPRGATGDYQILNVEDVIVLWDTQRILLTDSRPVR